MYTLVPPVDPAASIHTRQAIHRSTNRLKPGNNSRVRHVPLPYILSSGSLSAGFGVAAVVAARVSLPHLEACCGGGGGGGVLGVSGMQAWWPAGWRRPLAHTRRQAARKQAADRRGCKRMRSLPVD